MAPEQPQAGSPAKAIGTAASGGRSLGAPGFFLQSVTLQAFLEERGRDSSKRREARAPAQGLTASE